MTDGNKRAMAAAMVMGLELVVYVVAGISVGYYGGGALGSAEWGAVAGCFVGFALWIWRVVATKRHLSG